MPPSEEARRAGYQALYGTILSANQEMLELAAHFGFDEQSRSADEVTVVKRLQDAAASR